MSNRVLRCPKCGALHSIENDIYDHCMELKRLSDEEKIPCMPHPFTCGECRTELIPDHD